MGGRVHLKTVRRFLLGSSVVVCLGGDVAHAATYHVAKNGNDGNTCVQAQSTSTPKVTIAGGLKCLVAGDTLLIRAGTYDEGINNNVPSGTSWSSKVRIAAYSGETVWLRPTASGVNNNGYNVYLNGANARYIEFDGINFDNRSMPHNVMYIDDANGATVSNLRFQNLEVFGGPNQSYASIIIGGRDHEFINVTVHGGGRSGGCGTACSVYGFYVSGSRILIDNCDIYDVSALGVHVYSQASVPRENTVRNCRIHSINESGTPYVGGILLSGDNNQVYNNVIYGVNFQRNSGDAGIVVYTGSGNKIWNNTIVNNGTNGIKIDSGAANTEVRNNIAYGNSGSAFVNQGTGTTESNNLFGVDPLFVNLSGNDFKLKADSRAVDAGTNVSAVTTDLSGVARPQGRTHDIGAYEFSGQPAASGAPAPPTGVRIVSN